MEIEILRIFGKIRSKFNQQCKFIKRFYSRWLFYIENWQVYPWIPKCFVWPNKNEITLCDLTYFVNVQFDWKNKLCTFSFASNNLVNYTNLFLSILSIWLVYKMHSKMDLFLLKDLKMI